MGEKEKIRRLVARQHTLQLLGWDLDYESYLLCPHMGLPSCWESSGSSDYPTYDISISILICSVLAKAHFEASLISKMLQSFCPCHGHYMDIIWSICKQRVWTDLTCTLSLSRRVSVLALLADSLALQLTPSHNTVFISVQNLTLAPLLLGITKCKGWKSRGKPLLLPWQPWPLPRAENKHLAGLSYCKPVFLMIEYLQQ